ncbi:uncharacterized protein B0H18DRAFT_1068010, partial [Fomitopsis serialis]|uniref:uncharacterized protein n=1 Tax=Fomitopsis serialis TaxID=139415 RepID=UPI002007F2C9
THGSNVRSNLESLSDGFLSCFGTAQPRQEVDITMPDGSKRKGMSWETSPLDIAKEISKGLVDRVVIAKVPTVCPPRVARAEL